MSFVTADMNTRKMYGITLGERIALVPMRAVCTIARVCYGQSRMDAWETMQKLARENSWGEHELALACYLTFGDWEAVWYYVGGFKR